MSVVVTSSDDSGPGTLRQVLEDAGPGDIITFNPTVFPPTNPSTIMLTNGLPDLNQGGLTIDASNAGVILDGSEIANRDNLYGFHILSNSNAIRGFQIVGFSQAGIGLEGGASHNLIGGDRSVGAGPLGQGNLISNNGNFGIGMWETSHNIIQGNTIGVTLDGTEAWGHARDGIHSPGASYNLITDNIIGGNQSAGIYLCCVAEGHNTVTANIIGTNASGELPLGNAIGLLVDRTSHNVIGPDNIIAFNRGGITFWEDTLYNTITQNSLHDNRGPGSHSENRRPGIDVGGAGDERRLSPLILEFDLQVGSLAGLACANCIVEIFSDNEDEARNYEGQAIADESGFFTFSKGDAFGGAHLTAIATDPAGSSTEFSRPTDGARLILTLQENNTLARARFESKSSADLAENGVSINRDQLWDLNDETANWLLEEVTALGVKRFDISLHEVEPPINWNAGSELTISATVDHLIDRLIEQGVAVNIDLYFWDKDGHASGEELSTPRFQAENQIQDFLDFVRFTVNHFKGRVQSYAIWGEPGNCGAGGLKCVEASDYINLAKQTIPVIREQDPEAKVVLAPVVLYFAREWLDSVLVSDAIQLFDVIKTHPFYDAAPDIEFFGNYYNDYPSIVEGIMQTASANGFQGEYWGTDLTWWNEGNPNKPVDEQPWGSHTETEGVKYTIRVMVTDLGLDGATGVSTFSNTRWIYDRVRNLSTAMAGARPGSLTVDIESEATNVMSYGFTLDNGDKLFALWTDGVAIDFDPGVDTTLTFPGLSVSKVVAIDVLNGYEQELLAEMVGGDLVIRNLLVKDYPILIRLEG